MVVLLRLLGVEMKIQTINKLLQKRLDEVGIVRDKLRDDLSDLTELKERCEQAYDDIQSAINLLSELA